MASTNVCRLDSRSFVNLFTAIGLKNKWASRISALLEVAVDEDQVLTSHVCTKCTLGLVALENTCLQTAGFELLDCTELKLKRPQVTGGEVGVLSDTVRARPIKIKLLINNLV